MQLSSLFSLLLSLLSSLISASPLQPRQGHLGDSLVRTVCQFPNETWLENLAVRGNGKILVTLISAPEVWQVDPSADPVTTELIHRFPDAISLLGIAEYAPDVFAISVGNWSDKTDTYDVGSWSVWSLNMRSDWGEHHRGGWHHGPNHGSPVHKIADIPPAEFLNGMTVLPANPSTLLLSDSGAGLIYSFDTATGAYNVAIDDPVLKPNQSFPINLGVNGVQFRPGEDGYVYFTNSFGIPAFSKIPINPLTGAQIGPHEVVVDSFAKYNGGPDDFTFDSTGTAAYIADGALDGLVKVVAASGETEVLIGGTVKSKVVGETACHFGRTAKDIEKGTLYITNNGGLGVPPPQGIVGGGVYALDTAKL